ncbi:MAG TPA: transcription termination factor NusA [Gaiellaceae bacterium]|nr:transcription termination factor NusA [Gaiellaceae bacterium]
MSREIIELVHELERDRGIEGDTLVTALEDALLAAYKKTPGASRHAVVELDRTEGDFRVFSIELPEDIEERLIEEARERVLTELEEAEAENGERSHVLVTDEDLDIDWSDVPSEQVKRADVTPENFGRIAAQTAKQVITQRIREAERQIMYDEYVDRVTEVVTGIVQQAGDRNNVLVDLGKVEALLPRSEQVDGERYEQGSRIKAVITEVRSGTKGPQVILSRRDSELIRTLFELEVPEIADGLVEIRAVAREPGYRSKIAVESHAQGVDPVGACVGPRGSRVRMVVSELRGEKIDIIPWNPEPARFVAKALSPARVREVYLDDEAKEATVVVPDDQLALAIGKEGMNARLAARLTGWKVDIKSDTEFATEEAEAAFAGEGGEDTEFTGRCSAVLSTGKRCPNAALPGSRYCGVPAHQELALRPAADDEELIVEESEPELEAQAELAEPEAESIGPDSVELVRDEEELESEAPADAVATHGPSAEAIAGAEGEVDLDVAHPQEAPPEKLPGGIPIEPLDVAAQEQETAVDVSGGAGRETTLEGHETTTGEPPYSGAEGSEEESGDPA